MTFHARVYGNPVPWKRPKFRRQGAFVQAFEAEDVQDWKQTIQAQVLPGKPAAPFSGPLRMSLSFVFTRPKSIPKRIQHHVKRPDIDNLFKCLADALNGIVYVDDSQIVGLEIVKLYGEQPGAVIEVEEMVPGPEGLAAQPELIPAGGN